MKNKHNKQSRVQMQLMQKVESGPVIWSLSDELLQYAISKGLKVEPCLFSIRTKPFQRVKQLQSCLKKIHYSWKRGKSFLTMKLSIADRELLEEYGVSYKIAKWKIYKY